LVLWFQKRRLKTDNIFDTVGSRASLCTSYQQKQAFREPWNKHYCFFCWIYNYLCNQYISPLKFWVRVPLMVRYSIHHVIKFISDLRQVSGFLEVLRFPPSFVSPENTSRNYVSPSNEGRHIVLVWFFLPLPLLPLFLSRSCPDHNFFVFRDRSMIFRMWVHDHKAVCRVP
jgi:hypothetical protein